MIPFAISTENGFVTFYESGSLISDEDCGLVSSIVATETERWRNAGTRFESYQVICKTFDAIFGFPFSALSFSDAFQFDSEAALGT